MHRAEPGSASVKAAILDAASRLFAERGFASTGIRDIAADAGVNPAIVIRHFGSKEELFVRTVTLPDSWAEVMNGPLEQLGESLVRFIVESARTKPGTGAFAALLRASDRPGVQQSLQSSSVTVFVDPIVGRMRGSDTTARAHLFTAQLIGLMSALWVSEDPVLLALDADDIARLYGPALQSLLTGD